MAFTTSDLGGDEGEGGGVVVDAHHLEYLPNVARRLEKGVGFRFQGLWNNYLTEMCSGSEAGSYLRLIDILYHSTLGLRVIQKKKFLGSRVQGLQSTKPE